MPKITTALLIKADAINIQSINDYYYKPLAKLGISKDEIETYKLIYDTPKKVTAKVGKAWLVKVKKELPDTILNIIIADSNYYKWITKASTVSKHLGTSLLGKFEGYEEYRCVYVPNYKSLYKQPENQQLIDLGLDTIAGFVKSALIYSEEYATVLDSEKDLLDSLYQYPKLTVDIETTGLSLDSCIITIAFAWDKHNGVAVDIRKTGYWNVKEFLANYSGTLIMHNALFDAKLMISNWWMETETDYDGMQAGLDVFENVDDSMLLAFLEKNSTTNVDLGLKGNSIEYVGNYALDVTDATKHSQKDLLKYNLIDTLATWHVYDKFSSQLTSEAYVEIFQPSIKPLLKMMLIGLPLDQETVTKAYVRLEKQENKLRKQLAESPIIIKANTTFQLEAMEAANAKLVTKVKPIEDFSKIKFNPGSGKQVASVLFTQLELPILDTTTGGSPSTDAKTLKKLKHHTTETEIITLIDSILKISEISKITNTFLKAFRLGGDFLHGNLKLGGTQSGRLSSNSPNLTNLPAHGDMGKAIKSCVRAPEGYLFAAADYNALEARINAIVSQDPNRIKIYTQGYDSHCLNAYSYYKAQMPDIDPEDVDSVNSITSKYSNLRKSSKGPTFALTYGGTAFTLHKNAGIPMSEAIEIEDSYHELYAVSDEFAEKNKVFAIKHGYMECAFGLRIKTPIISKSIMNNQKTPYAATAEVRSANNAVTQSWGMLLNRAVIATNHRIEQAKLHKEILPINMIHDAAYFLVKDAPEVIKFLNDVLIEEMEWNDHPTIKSKDIPMLSELDIGKSWDSLTTIPNKATVSQIKEILEESI
jgi:DNA polymerase I